MPRVPSRAPRGSGRNSRHPSTSNEASAYSLGRRSRRASYPGPAAGGTLPRAADNKLLIQSTSFETGISGWVTGSANVLIAQSSEAATHGSYSLKMTRANSAAVLQVFSAAAVDVMWASTPGARLWWQFDIMTPVAGKTWRPRIRFYDAARASLGDHDDASASRLLTPGVWTTLKGSIVAPANAAWANPFAQSITNYEIGEVAYIDRPAGDVLDFERWAPGPIL